MSAALKRVERWLASTSDVRIWDSHDFIADLRAVVALAKKVGELERRLKLADDAVDSLVGAGVRAALSPRRKPRGRKR